jgi:AraC-like DNA-binding protein
MLEAYAAAAAVKVFRFGEDVMEPGKRYIPEAGRLEVWLALSGTATVLIEGQTIRFDAGQAMLIQTSVPYIYQATGLAPHLLSWCESEPLTFSVLPWSTPRLFPFTPIMTMLVDLGLAAERRPAPIRDALALQLGQALLIEVLSRIDAHGEDRRRRETAERLSAVIAADPLRDWTSRGMARAVGMSARTLNRRLALDGSPSASDLLWRVRVRLGAELLVRSDASCSDIADQCGFQNVPHFSRRIKQLTGMTPLRVRHWAVSASLAERADFFRDIERSRAQDDGVDKSASGVERLVDPARHAAAAAARLGATGAAPEVRP